MESNRPINGRVVLIAIDGSRHSERALRWYAEKLHRPDDAVVLVNVTEPPELALGFGMAGMAVAENYTAAINRAMSEARQLAEVTRNICVELGICSPDLERDRNNLRFLERLGRSAGPVIAAVAEEESVDLIVIGSRGSGLVRRTVLGSVSDYVLHHSHKPMVVVPPPTQEQN